MADGADLRFRETVVTEETVANALLDEVAVFNDWVEDHGCRAYADPSIHPSAHRAAWCTAIILGDGVREKLEFLRVDMLTSGPVGMVAGVPVQKIERVIQTKICVLWSPDLKLSEQPCKVEWRTDGRDVKSATSLRAAALWRRTHSARRSLPSPAVAIKYSLAVIALDEALNDPRWVEQEKAFNARLAAQELKDREG